MKWTIDPRAAFLVSAALSLNAVACRNLYGTVAIFAVTMVYALCMSVTLAAVFRKLKRLWQIILSLALLNSVFSPSGYTLVAIGGVKLLTVGGLAAGTVVFLRMSTLIMCAATLALYSHDKLARGMIQFRLPYELCYMVTTGIRFIPMIGQQLRDSMTAIQLRGVDLKKIGMRRRLKAGAYIILPSVAAAAHHARSLSDSMQMRGFRAYPKRTSLRRLKMTAVDIVICAVAVLMAAAGIALAVLGYYG